MVLRWSLALKCKLCFMGSLSWGEITQMYRGLTHQVEMVREEVREAEEWLTYLKNTGIGVVTAFSLLVFLAIVW